MIKARKGNQLIIGLSHHNIELIKAGKPIKFDAGQVGFEGIEVFIFAGKDEMEMQQMMAPAIDPLKTKFGSDRAAEN